MAIRRVYISYLKIKPNLLNSVSNFQILFKTEKSNLTSFIDNLKSSKGATITMGFKIQKNTKTEILIEFDSLNDANKFEVSIREFVTASKFQTFVIE